MITPLLLLLLLFFDSVSFLAKRQNPPQIRINAWKFYNVYQKISQFGY